VLVPKNISYSARGVNPARLEAILEYAGNSVLDVGCGSGAYVLKLADRFDIRGVDNQHFDSWDMMPDLFSLSDASTLAWEDDSVDTILSFETLEHLSEPEAALKEYYRVCRKNLILTVPNCKITSGMRKSLLTYYHYTDRTHVNFFDMETIVDLVEKAKFKVTQQNEINQISLFPLIYEAFDFSGFWGKLTYKMLMRSRYKNNYYLTCLVVGEKTI